MKTTNAEVLMYIQNIKKYFESNEIAQKYFNIKGNEETFYKYLVEQSEQNFKDNGEPELSIVQFEELKLRLSGVSESLYISHGVFISMGELGFISLN